MSAVNIIDIMKVNKTQRQIAEVYAKYLYYVETKFWKEINEYLLTRYKPSGLENIKRLAWKIAEDK